MCSGCSAAVSASPMAGFAASTPTARTGLPKRKQPQVHRCSRCGQTGHNVRNCPLGTTTPGRGWYAQRCSICGEVGHNARNCTNKGRSEGGRCPVCGGRGTLPCGQCAGTGRAVGSMSNAHALVRRQLAEQAERARVRAAAGRTPALDGQEREWARLARERAKLARRMVEADDGGIDGDQLVGSTATTTATTMTTAPAAAAASATGGVVEGELVGGKSVLEVQRGKWERALEASSDHVCARCQGLGYLTCLSCGSV